LTFIIIPVTSHLKLQPKYNKGILTWHSWRYYTNKQSELHSRWIR